MATGADSGHTGHVTTSTGVSGVSGTVTIVDRADQHRYELRIDDKVCGLVVYSDDGSARALVHTEIDDSRQGQGLAGDLVRQVLDDARRDHRQVVPACPYVERFIERHPAYRDLLVGAGPVSRSAR